MLDQNEIERQNAQGRISVQGLGAELIRRHRVKTLRVLMEAFYAHASLADLDALVAALELQDGMVGKAEGATLIEALLTILDVAPACVWSS